MSFSRLDDDVRARILYEAAKPFPWPWSDVRLLDKSTHELCRRHQTRLWFVAHSSICPAEARTAAHAAAACEVRHAACASSTTHDAPTHRGMTRR